MSIFAPHKEIREKGGGLWKEGCMEGGLHCIISNAAIYCAKEVRPMLLFDDSKKLEKALGEEAASILAHVFEKADGQWRSELATKADLMTVKADIQNLRENMATKAELAATENRILRWMVGGFLAQTALLVAVMGIAAMAFLR
jgi:hypothetical protein